MKMEMYKSDKCEAPALTTGYQPLECVQTGKDKYEKVDGCKADSKAVTKQQYSDKDCKTKTDEKEQSLAAEGTKLDGSCAAVLGAGMKITCGVSAKYVTVESYSDEGCKTLTGIQYFAGLPMCTDMSSNPLDGKKGMKMTASGGKMATSACEKADCSGECKEMMSMEMGGKCVKNPDGGSPGYSKIIDPPTVEAEASSARSPHFATIAAVITVVGLVLSA